MIGSPAIAATRPIARVTPILAARPNSIAYLPRLFVPRRCSEHPRMTVAPQGEVMVAVVSWSLDEKLAGRRPEIATAPGTRGCSLLG